MGAFQRFAESVLVHFAVLLNSLIIKVPPHDLVQRLIQQRLIEDLFDADFFALLLGALVGVGSQGYYHSQLFLVIFTNLGLFCHQLRQFLTIVIFGTAPTWFLCLYLLLTHHFSIFNIHCKIHSIQFFIMKFQNISNYA